MLLTALSLVMKEMKRQTWIVMNRKKLYNKNIELEDKNKNKKYLLQPLLGNLCIYTVYIHADIIRLGNH